MSITEASVSDRPFSVRERLNALARADKARMKRSRLDDGAVPQIRADRREVELVAETIKVTDKTGKAHISQPYRSIDMLERMLKNGYITAEMRAAASSFQDDFDKSHLEQLRAADMGRVSVSGSRAPELSETCLGARERVWRAIVALGGLSSPVGGCAWYVLGHQATIDEWAARERWNGREINRHMARGVLIGALGMLQFHYEGTPGKRP